MFPEIVVLSMYRFPELVIPPPAAAVLRERVVSNSRTVPPSLKIPPPERAQSHAAKIIRLSRHQWTRERAQVEETLVRIT